LVLLTLRLKRQAEESQGEKLDSLGGGDLGAYPSVTSESFNSYGHIRYDGSRSMLGSDRTSNFTNLTIALESTPSTHLPSYTHPPSYTQSPRSHMDVDDTAQPMSASSS
jgi:hypothetical protein